MEMMVGLMMVKGDGDGLRVDGTGDDKETGVGGGASPAGRLLFIQPSLKRYFRCVLCSSPIT